MNEAQGRSLLDLVTARRGHFRLESGHHGALWLDLDALFANSRRIAPLVAQLATAIGRHQVSAVCGPLLGGAFLAQLLAQALDVEFWFAERVAPAETGGLYETRYRLPAALASRARDHRVAIVDDVMSAGSSLRATFAELRAHGAQPVVVGVLLALGRTGLDFLDELELPVEALARDAYELWLPAACPLCAARIPLENI